MNIESRRLAFVARTEQDLREGHDRFRAAQFVAEATSDLEGPALDVGTGKGLLGMALVRRGLDVVSVDVNEEDSALAALLAREAGLDGRIRFLLGDGRSLPLPDRYFGSVAMMDVLHHLEDVAPVLGEMIRVIRPRGRIVVADFTEEGFELVAAAHRAEGREHPRSAVTMDEVGAVLTAAGWRLYGETTGHLHRVAWFGRA
jgi:ubiquinone/menaquinone biosynthesis C-methylase UbiE